MEIWKIVPSVPNYEVSNKGRLIHIKHKKIRKPFIDRGGYEVNHLLNGVGKIRTYRRHRLVAEAFIGPLAESVEVDHIDRNRRNNCLDNLRVVDRNVNLLNKGNYDPVIVANIIKLHQEGKTVEQISTAVSR